MSKNFVRLDSFARANVWHLHDRLALVHKAGSKFVVSINWSRSLTVRHEATFDDVAAAVKLVGRINNAGRITTACWLAPQRAA